MVRGPSTRDGSVKIAAGPGGVRIQAAWSLLVVPGRRDGSAECAALQSTTPGDRRRYGSTIVRRAGLAGVVGFVSLPLPWMMVVTGAVARERVPICAQSGSNRSCIDPEQIAWLREATRKQLQGCRVQGKGGVWLYTPDGVGNYRAFWTRDFAYMVQYAGDLLDAHQIKRSIQYLLAGQRADGCMPDRVNVAGVPVYGPGPEPGVGHGPLADHALDNGPFMAALVCSYADLTGDIAWFRQVEPAIRRGLDHTRRAPNGLVYNPPDAPLCPYGFTDTVAKTGHLLFCSLLYYDACKKMARLCDKAACGEPAEYLRRARQIREHLDLLWNPNAGMFWAADRDCRQIDIWGSALAVDLRCTDDVQADWIAAYLASHYDQIVQRGQVRHLPGGEAWQRFAAGQGPRLGTYQNGAFWATPVAWVAPTLARSRPDLAVRMVRDVIADFRQRGIMECVNGDYHAVPDYVASATNVYGLLRDAR